MKTKRIFFQVSLALLLLSGCNSISSKEVGTFNENISISKMQSSADYSIPVDMNELIKQSDHIVTVKALQNVGHYLIDGEPLGTKKEVEITESHDSLLEKGKKIIVVEPAYVEEGMYIATESYLLMEAGKEYILFLMNGKHENEYGIVALGYGKYSKDGEIKQAELSDYKKYGELKGVDFISDASFDIELYDQIKKDVLNAYAPF